MSLRNLYKSKCSNAPSHDSVLENHVVAGGATSILRCISQHGVLPSINDDAKYIDIMVRSLDMLTELLEESDMPRPATVPTHHNGAPIPPPQRPTAEKRNFRRALYSGTKAKSNVEEASVDAEAAVECILEEVNCETSTTEMTRIEESQEEKLRKWQESRQARQQTREMAKSKTYGTKLKQKRLKMRNLASHGVDTLEIEETQGVTTTDCPIQNRCGGKRVSFALDHEDIVSYDVDEATGP